MNDPMTLEITLKSLFDTCPAVIPVFLRHHMSCVGCYMSAFDTLGDALVNYQLDASSFRSELSAAANCASAPASNPT